MRGASREELLHSVGEAYVFDLDIRDYNLWMAEKMPVILILFDAARRRAYWLAVKDYFRENAGGRPQKGAKNRPCPRGHGAIP